MAQKQVYLIREFGMYRSVPISSSSGEYCSFSVQFTVTLYLHSVNQLREQHATREELVWDKVCAYITLVCSVEPFIVLHDERCSMDFVVAAANLRAFAFGIHMKSRFDIKCK